MRGDGDVVCLGHGCQLLELRDPAYTTRVGLDDIDEFVLDLFS